MRIRRLLVAGLVFVLVVVGAGVVYYLSNSTAIESWIGSQLLNIAGTYLEPEMHYDKLTYKRPYTVVLEGFSLSSPDPTQGGKKVAIVAAKRVELTLTEIPKRGQPIKFSEVMFEDPEFRAIAAEPGKPGFVGFSKLLKSSGGSAEPATSGPGAAAPQAPASAAPTKLSDFLLIRHVGIKNGLIRYDPRLAGTQAMQLDQINMALSFQPSDKPGFYAISTTIDRSPVFQLGVDGQVNIDSFTLDLSKCNLNLDLQEQNAHYLPPEIQKILGQYGVTGQLRITVAGTLPVSDTKKVHLTTNVTLEKAGVAYDKYKLAVDSFGCDLEVANGVATIQKANARLLGGDLQVSGAVPMDPLAESRIQVQARNIQIEQTLRVVDPKAPPPYAGKVSADVMFQGPLAQWNTRAQGNGNVALREGKMDNLPVIGTILSEINGLLKTIGGGQIRIMSDTLDTKFTLKGDHAQIDSLNGQAAALALRGNGTISFDGRLDLRLNAGPMERLQKLLGKAGDAWAQASDFISDYHVTGTMSAPHVSLEMAPKNGSGGIPFVPQLPKLLPKGK